MEISHDIQSVVESFYINLNRVHAILVSTRANGDSSYRDASAIARILVSRYQIHPSTICIITDDARKIKPNGCVIKHVKNKSELQTTIEQRVGQLNEGDHLIFSLSGHGYSKVVPSRSLYEMNGRSEFIQVNGDTVLDIELFQSLYGNMKNSIRSLCLIDTCHSGTMLDLEYTSVDGQQFRRSRTPLIRRPESVCISACNDNESAGEDVSNFAGWGGKLTCQFLDYLSMTNESVHLLYPLKMYKHIRNIFIHQSIQRTHPVISFNSS